MRDPSADGCTHVGEQLDVARLRRLHAVARHVVRRVVGCARRAGAPCMPRSFPFPTTKCRDTANVRVSISTAMSSIMQAEYCFVPCALMREPCGIVHVGTRATSTISSVATIEHARGDHLPVEVEVDDVGERAVRRDLHRRRKVAEHHSARERVVRQRVLPQEAVRRAVRGGHVVELPIRRHRHAVRAVDVRGHDPRRVRPLDPDPCRSEAHDGDLIDRLRRHEREVILRRRLGDVAPRLPAAPPWRRMARASARRTPATSGEKDEAGSRESSDHRSDGTHW